MSALTRSCITTLPEDATNLSEKAELITSDHSSTKPIIATDLRPNFGGARYTAGGAAATARAALVSYGWTITDGGVA